MISWFIYIISHDFINNIPTIIWDIMAISWLIPEKIWPRHRGPDQRIPGSNATDISLHLTPIQRRWRAELNKTGGVLENPEGPF